MWRVVMFSAGIGSWAAGMRVAEKYGTEKLILLFTDVKHKLDQHPHRGEDQDAYRFLVEGAQVIGGKLVWISRGKHIWQTFEDNRYMGNSRVDPCSRELKRELAREWVEKHFKPDEVTLYIGIDWTEMHRCASNEKAWYPYKVEFPMCDQPYLVKSDMCRWAESLGVKRPRLYDLGFSHNNCGGFCVKAGLGQFYNLLKTMPERYAYHESKQEELFSVLGKRVPFLRQTVNGKLRYLSLKEFREQVEAGKQIDMFDLGGCGCFGDVDLSSDVETA
ncbi:hypothetical protein [Cohnella sp.]|uniref:hypothetical protein n=1 Tax=Cohnella sp. TaxID=1883426 RepID=UPI003567CD9B